MFKHALALVGIFLSILTLSANAALYDRGDGLIYDDVLNITWLQNANYAAKQYEDTKGLEGSEDGRMTWEKAKEWVENLSYQGHDDWRLPSVGSNPDTGFNRESGELGYMFYVNLSNTKNQDTGAIKFKFQDAANNNVEKEFSDLQDGAYGVYWYKEKYITGLAWAFRTTDGDQIQAASDNKNFIWAVRTGDYKPLPVPEAAWLFGMGLISLVGVKRRYR